MVPTFFIFLFLLTSCDLLKPAAERIAPKAPAGQKEASADPSQVDFMTAGQKFAFHRALVTEMQEQIFARPSRGTAEVDGWANVLSQRGSIEGVYHGFVLSADYAALEKGKADLKSLRFFAQEMAALDFPNAQDSDEKIAKAGEKYVNEYMGVPLFTLKRVLGERVIAESVARKADRVGLATWYANFVNRWAKDGVSFGMPQRDKADEAYHFRWAQENTIGMIQWELLNRVHRVLNAYGGVPFVASAAPVAAPTAPAKPVTIPAGK